MKIEVHGDKDLERKLRALPGQIQLEAAEPAVKQAAVVFLGAVRDAAPVRTGKGRRSFRVKRPRKARPGAVELNVKNSGARYMGYLERGTQRLAARHFVRRAFGLFVQHANREAIQTLKTKIEQLGAR